MLFGPKRLTQEEILQLEQAMKADVLPRVQHYSAALGVKVGRVTVRCQKTRWGSCSSKGNLNFNCLLMLAPEFVRDAVVAHEVAHRREMNHSARFYALLQQICPHSAEAKTWLTAHGRELMARRPRE